MKKYSRIIIGSIILAAMLGSGFRRAVASATDELLANDGNDATNPINRFDARTQITWLPDINTPSQVFDGRTYESETLRNDTVFFSKPDQLQLRIDVPLAWANIPTAQNPNGLTRFGLGDVLMQGLYSHLFNPRWATAVGVRAFLPTATDQALGAGKLQIGPTVDVRASLPEVSVGSYASLTVRQFFSAGGDPSRRDIKYTSIQPQINIALPNQWYLNTAPNIQYNLRSRKWFVPIDGTIGKKFGEPWTVSFEYIYGLVQDNPRYSQFIDFQIGYFY
jgi:hypothetical protein